MIKRHLSPPISSQKLSKSISTHSMTDQRAGKLDVLKHMVDTCPIIEKTSSLMDLKNIKSDEKSATPKTKKISWIEKSPFSDTNTQIIQLSAILDQVSTQKEKDLKPFWTKQSKEKSEKLWLPTEIDSVDSILTSSKESSAPMGKSWFSIETKYPKTKNSSQSSRPFQEDFTDLEVIQSKIKSKMPSKETTLKTLKIRIFPTKDEKDKLSGYFDQFRWYYNAILNIVNKTYMKDGKLTVNKLSYYNMRNLLMKYDYIEDDDNKDFKYNNIKNSFPIPVWWENVNGRVIRGSIKKFTSSVNAAISNLKNGNIRKFKMSFQTKKKPVEIVHFEDKNYPVFLNDIKSIYWFTDNGGKRRIIEYKDIGSKKGLEIIHEKDTDRYFYHVPVEVDWFPDEDRRNENQVSTTSERNTNQQSKRIISLDPGVRKFLVGYDPSGKLIYVGDGASKRLAKLLLETDVDYKNPKLWRKIKNLVTELHNKIVKYLVSNYDEILLPEFRVADMLKGKKLGRMTKRLLNMFSFYRFRVKMEDACMRHGKKLYIVDESYTSCTCTSCGNIKRNLKGDEVYRCNACGLEVDRDVNGSRNILIKNIKTLR